jgi:hypothetical protein
LRGNKSPSRALAHTTISADFLGSTTAERLSMCRKLAADAANHAAEAANPETQRAYLDLKRQWEVLAGELEAAGEM